MEEILSVKTYGKDRKILKIELSQKIKKSIIITAVKRKRPDGLYILEFLVPARLKLFHEVRLFAKTVPEKIDRVFTRNGFIYYRHKTTGQINTVDSDKGILKLKDELAA